MTKPPRLAMAMLAPLAAWLPCAPPGDDGRQVEDVYAEGDEAHWVIEAAGARIGSHWSTYLGVADLLGVEAHHFLAGVAMEQVTQLGKLDVRKIGELWTDARGHPLRFLVRATAAGTYSSVDVTFDDGKATARIAQGPSVRDVTVAVPPESYLLANNFVAHLELIGALAPPEAGEVRKLNLFSPDAFQVLPFELRHQGSFKTQAGDAEIEGVKYRDSLGELMKVLPDGKLHELDVVQAGVRFRRVDLPAEKFVIEAPKAARKAFDREEVEIRHGDVTLAGTITKRQGTSGRMAALFFVSGSGLQDREGMSGGIELGTHEILDRLTEEGFLVLRVDDRGAGASIGSIDGLTFDDLLADARACVDFLLARPDVDPERVAVIGHSEGGITAPILACERPLAAIALLAGTGRSLFAVMQEQKRQALEDANVPKPLIELSMKEHARFLEQAAAEGDLAPDDLSLEYRPVLKDRNWIRSHAKRDPIAQIKQVKCPVLVLHGELDWQVSSERDAKALAQALEGAGHPDATLRLFPKLDHLFKVCTSEKPSMADYLKPRPVDREFLDVLAAWLKERLKP